MYRYLTDVQIKGFDDYKYCSIDNSPIAVYISHPFWNYLVKFFPMWLAPNLITFMGFICVLATLGVVSYYDWYLYASSDTVGNGSPIPNWVWLFCGIATLLSHILDGIDGRQARRTGTSGPTGELFDHGIDSWHTIPFTIVLFSIFGRADFSISALRILLILIAVQFVFIVTHWEKYNTGVLFLSWGYDLSQYSLVIVYLVTFFVDHGYAMWKVNIPMINMNPCQIGEIFFYASTLGMSLPMSLYNIWVGYNTKSGKMYSFYEAILPLFSTILLFYAAVIWAIMSPTDVLSQDPRTYMLFMGTIFSNIAWRLVIAQMSSTRAEPVNKLVILYCFLVLLCLTSPMVYRFELIILRVATVVIVLAHVHYAVCVINQLCEHFGIRVFSLQKRSLTGASAKEGFV